VINALLLAVSEEQLWSNLRGDLPLVILGSIIAAIGVAAVVLYLARWQSIQMEQPGWDCLVARLLFARNALVDEDFDFNPTILGAPGPGLVWRG
jgi:hypothetical protein